ncbi:hypothetical protein BN946_scf184464.g2 [Trametes cinnabarina]|uniref:Uncharacterized protein n=1 Tax=Pycnoporus cinnabarinus TaxID=5643 RepID=A0A060STG0_PYCCI|nr:hypothetical protein BN946_scf184464.g2 [Trametes cinnabarina]
MPDSELTSRALAAKVQLPDPLANITWGTPPRETTAAGLDTPGAAQHVPATAAPVPSTPENDPLGSSSLLPVMTPAQTADPTVTVQPLAAGAPKKGKGRAPKPRKVTISAWPPPDDSDHAKPKDVCARIWYLKNPDQTREDFDQWYKQMTHYKRLAYVASGGKAPTIARSTVTSNAAMAATPSSAAS